MTREMSSTTSTFCLLLPVGLLHSVAWTHLFLLVPLLPLSHPFLFLPSQALASDFLFLPSAWCMPEPCGPCHHNSNIFSFHLFGRGSTNIPCLFCIHCRRGRIGTCFSPCSQPPCSLLYLGLLTVLQTSSTLEVLLSPPSSLLDGP